MTADHDRWFAFRAWNCQTLYGFGNGREAELYCRKLNETRDINVYAAEELDDAAMIESLEDGDNLGFDIANEL